MESIVPVITVLAALLSSIVGLVAWFAVSRSRKFLAGGDHQLTLVKPNEPAPNGLLVGEQNGRDIYYVGSGNILTFGRSGSGKTWTLARAIAGFKGATLAYDPRGGLRRVTQELRGQSDKRVLSIGPRESLYINPFDLLDPQDPLLEDDCRLLAGLLLPSKPNEDNDYIVLAARRHLSETISTLARSPNEDQRTLTSLRQHYEDGRVEYPINTRGRATGLTVFESLREQGGYQLAGGIFALLADALQRIDNRMGRTAPGLEVNIMEPPENTNIFFTEYGTYEPFYTQIIYGLLLAKSCRPEAEEAVPRLFVLDDAASFNSHKVLSTSFSLAPAARIQIWAAFQSVSQVRHHLDTGLETVLSNSEVIQILSVGDIKTDEFLRRFARPDQQRLIGRSHRDRYLIVNGRLLVADPVSLTEPV